MRSRQYASKPLANFLHFAGNVLIALGTPPLFALKIILWTAVWLVKSTLNLIVSAVDLAVGIGDTSLWLIKTVYLAATALINDLSSQANKRLAIFFTVARKYHRNSFFFTERHLQLLAKKYRQLAPPQFPSFSLPRLAIPIGPLAIPAALRNCLLLLLGFLIAVPLLVIPVWAKTELDQLPNPSLLANRDIPVSTKIYDRSSVLLYQIYSSENRTIVDPSSLPPYITEATIAIEDKNFFHHPGFDPQGIIRAAIANANGRATTQGGSTITQQLIKSALLTPQRTISRKIKELILAFWAERIFSKQEILKMYLNQVSYGGAAYGIDAAAQTYFGKPAKDLTLAESALLAGLPSAPSVYSPFGTHPELTKQRQLQVLNSMAAQGYISQFQAEAAAKEDLKFNQVETSIKAPHFVMYVKDYLTQKYGARVVERGGLEVTTSLDYPTYETVSKLIHDDVAAQKNLNVGNGAALVTNPATGEILAMVGSTDFFDLKNDGNVNVTISPRSPGSSIKPLNYALAFEKGLITPATVIDDTPITYRTPNQPDYSPRNYDNRFHGKVTARVALASSFNIPAVKVLEKVSLDNFIDQAEKMGITTWSDRSRFGLSLTLGGGEVTMTDMATAYSAFATNGYRVNLKPVLLIKDFRGNILEDNRDPNATRQDRVISPHTAFLVSSILADNAARTLTFGPSSNLNIPGHTVSVKTGTTETKRDNWTIGYTPHLLTEVWVGNNNNSPMSPHLESGNTGAAAIWNPIMTGLLTDQPNEVFVPPDDIIPVTVCALTGTLPCDNCPSTHVEYFTRGTEPKFACKLTPEDVDKLTKPNPSGSP